MNSEKAFNISIENANILVDKEYDSIIEKILLSAKKGLMSLFIKYPLYAKTYNKLEKTGYNIKICDVVSEYFLIISWESPKS